MMMGIMVMPEPEDTASTQPVTTPDPIETIGEGVVVPEDSAQDQVDVAPIEQPHPNIR
jgi:hypothetical protein